MGRNEHFKAGSNYARMLEVHPEFFRPRSTAPQKSTYERDSIAHPEFFKPPKYTPTQDLGDLENAQAYKRGKPVNLTKAPAKKAQKSQVVEPGTIVPPRGA